MKKKIFLVFFLLGLSAVSYSDVEPLDEAGRKEAQKILENVRKRIEKEDKERAKAQAEAERLAQEEAEKAAEEAKKIEEEQSKAAQEQAMEAARERNVEVVETPVEASTTDEAVDVTEVGLSKDKDKLVAEYLKEKERLAQEEKKNLKTPMEKLEYTRKQALEKVDFYERVVRSVGREEQEINSYKEILDMDI